MTPDEAILLSQEFFPNGLDVIVNRLDIEVRYGELIGCDGWCLSSNSKTIIRINSLSSVNRQKFTLAHELSHVLLGIAPSFGERLFDNPDCYNSEERKVDLFASELLIPKSIVENSINLPVSKREIFSLAKHAKISLISTTIRVSNVINEIENHSSIVVFINDSKIEWSWSSSNESLFCKDFIDEVVNELGFQQDRYLKKVIENKFLVSYLLYASKPEDKKYILFIQLLPLKYANTLILDEEISRLGKIIFRDDFAFQQSVSGCFGAMKRKVSGMKLEDAIKLFYSLYKNKWDDDKFSRLLTEEGKSFVKLKLSKWTNMS